MSSSFVVKYIDYDGEPSRAMLRGATVNSGNFTAQETAALALVTSLDAVTLGTKASVEYKAYTTRFAPSKPTDQNAQRESKWVFHYFDNVTYEWDSCDIPCADLSLLDDENRGQMSKDAVINPEWATLKTNFEAFYKSSKGNSVTLDHVTHQGRNI